MGSHDVALIKEIQRLNERIEKIEIQLKNLREFRVKAGSLDEPQELSFEGAKTLVNEFLAEMYEINDVVYPSDVAEDLNLDYNLVLEIFEELVKEEKLE